MLGHYLVLALRNLRRAPFAAAVNVLTLAIGLACFVTAYAFVTFWERAEQAFGNADRTYVLSMSTTRRGDDDGPRPGGPFTPAGVAELLKTDFPAIDKVARAIVIDRQKTNVSSGDRAVRLDAFAVDPEFLTVFDLPIVAGDSRLALSTPRSAVITKEYAAQLFGDADPIGRSLLIGNVVDATVTGVIDAIAEPSHMGRSARANMRFDLLASMDVQETIYRSTLPPNFRPSPGWFSQSFGITYLLLPSDGSLSVGTLRRELPAFAARHVPPDALESLGLATITLDVQPVRDLLRTSGQAIFLRGIGASPELELLLLGTLVLAVACVNYANLATARLARRTREVGLRRTLGARPAQIIAQFLLETALLTAVALIVALVVFREAMPLLEFLAGADFSATLFESTTIWSFLLVVLVAVTIAAGAYPAFVLSRVAPVTAIRAGRSAIGPKRLATLLVGAQFGVASLLLIAVAVTSMQNAALERTGFGVTDDPLVVIANPSSLSKVDSATLGNELARLPHVTGTTEMRFMPWDTFVMPQVSDSPDPTSAARTILMRDVGFDFFAVFDIELLAGRVFNRDVAEDAPAQIAVGREAPPQGSATPATPGTSAPDAASPATPRPPRNVVVDRAFTAEFGFQTPADAVGEVLYFANRSGPGGTASPPQPLRTVGVVETVPFAFESYMASMPRGTIYTATSGLDFQVARIAAGEVAAAIEGIDGVWKRLAPNVAINRQFLDDVFNQRYESYLRINRIFSGLALMAFFIATVGLFGMATLVSGRRAKEIGLRKTLGASKRQMIVLLLGSFARPVIVANLVVWPIAYVAVRAYLVRFIDPIALTPVPFAVSLAVTVAIAALAVLAQTLRAASARPADVLRYD